MVEPILKQPRRPSPQKRRKAEKRRELTDSAQLVIARSRGICEVCCDARATQVHHKAGRRVPGANHPSMLLHLCLWCHTEVHSSPEWSYEQGYLIRPTTVDCCSSCGVSGPRDWLHSRVVDGIEVFTCPTCCKECAS